MKKNKIFLIGNPNVGKTVVFNALTHQNAKVGNFAGTTIESRKGDFVLPDNSSVEIVDLAGVYSSRGRKHEERIAWEKIEEVMTEKSAIFLQIINPSQWKQSIALTLDLQQKGIKPVLFFNTKKTDVTLSPAFFSQLEKEFLTPVFFLDAAQENFSSDFLSIIRPLLEGKIGPKNPPRRSFSSDQEKFAIVETIFEKFTPQRKEKSSSFSNFLDKIFLNPILGFLSFFTIMWLVFEITFTFGAIPMDWIDSQTQELIGFLKDIFGTGLLASVMIDGVVAGLGATIIFLPNIIMLFFFLAILKESGYLARTSYLFDRLFKKIGTSGKASVHLLMGFGCNVPSIMAVKHFETKKEKIIVSMMTLFMSCGARLPVYTLLISAFIPQGYQGVTLWSLYMFGIIIALITAVLVDKGYKKSIRPKNLIYEMPKLVFPSLKNAGNFALLQGKIFLVRVGKFIIPASIILWVLFTFPTSSVSEQGIEASYGATISKAVTPIFEPIGFDWKITAAVISGIAAKEVMVATFAEIFESPISDDEEVIGETLKKSGSFSLGVALSLLFFTLLYTPCMAVLGVLRGELGLGWTIFAVFYPAAVGWIVGFILFRVF